MFKNLSKLMAAVLLVGSIALFSSCNNNKNNDDPKPDPEVTILGVWLFNGAEEINTANNQVINTESPDPSSKFEFLKNNDGIAYEGGITTSFYYLLDGDKLTITYNNSAPQTANIEKFTKTDLYLSYTFENNDGIHVKRTEKLKKQ